MTIVQRFAFLVSWCLAIGLTLSSVGVVHAADANGFTTVYIVRHAETVDGGADRALSDVGRARAEELASVLGEDGVDAIYVTNYARTQQTAVPMAEQAGITPVVHSAGDTQFVVDQIRSAHSGERILVVAHSNTVDDIANGLGAENVSDLAGFQFDRLFVVHLYGDDIHLDRLRYGTASAEGDHEGAH